MSIDNNGERSTRYEGYSDYNSISRQVARSVDDAVEAYAKIQSLHKEGARVRPEIAAEASSHILSAAIKLRSELEQDRDDVEYYDDVLERWNGSDGFIERLKNVRLTNDCPEFLERFASDIREAGFRLGYLQAGQHTDTEKVSWKDGDVSAMFE